jgi:hypothetical protein
VGGDFQPGCLADWLLTGATKIQLINKERKSSVLLRRNLETSYLLT